MADEGVGSPTVRHAIYFTPPAGHPLTKAAAGWLQRDAFGRAPGETPTGGPSPEFVERNTDSARRYGFHATLKAPFRLAEGETEAGLEATLAAYARTILPVVIDRLVLVRIDGFFALVPAAASADLQDFAADVVRRFDRFRAPLSETEMARRRPELLGPSERANLQRWGYPHVFGDFRFHMTLTDRVAGDDAARLRTALEAVFAAFLDRPLAVDGLALFVEPSPGAPFVVRSYHPIGQSADLR